MTSSPSSATLPACPRCAQRGGVQFPDAYRPDEFVCGLCGARGQHFAFDPVRAVERAETALPDEAACAHHPHKRAVAICAGSGDFVCALCRVEMDGRAYSIPYLESGGQPIANAAFEPTLRRPDRPAVFFVIMGLVFFWVPVLPLVCGIGGLVQGARAWRLRRREPLYREAMSGLMLGLLLGLSLGVLALGVLMTFTWLDRIPAWR